MRLFLQLTLCSLFTFPVFATVHPKSKAPSDSDEPSAKRPCTDQPECRASTSNPNPSPGIDADLELFIKAIQNDVVKQTLLEYLPPELSLTSNDNCCILHIKGDEFTPDNWPRQQVFLDLLNNNYLSEVHIDQFPFTPSTENYLFQLLKRNAGRIHTLTITNCMLDCRCKFDWDMSLLTALCTFKISNMNLNDEQAEKLLESLPTTLLSLDISLAVVLSMRNHSPFLTKLVNLETLKLQTIGLFPEKDWASAIVKLKKLSIVHLPNTAFSAFALNALTSDNYSWSELIMTHYNCPYEKLIFLKGLAKLALPRDSHIRDCLDFINANIDSFKQLKIINLSGYFYNSDGIRAIDLLLDKKIDVHFDFDRHLLARPNWTRYLAMFTKIWLNSDQIQEIFPAMIAEVQANNTSFHNVTRFIVTEFIIPINFDLLIEFINYLPNLKVFTLKLHCENESYLDALQIAEPIHKLESLEIHAGDQSLSADFITALVGQFAQVKKIEIHCSTLVNVASIFTVNHWNSVEELALKTVVGYSYFEKVFKWISTLPNLKSFAVKFGSIKSTHNKDKTLNECQYTLANLQPLKLKKLKLELQPRHNRPIELYRLFQNLSYLKHLDVKLENSSDFNALISGFSSLNRLRYLEIAHKKKEDESLNLFEGLKNLPLIEEVYTKCDVYIDALISDARKNKKLMFLRKIQRI